MEDNKLLDSKRTHKRCCEIMSDKENNLISCLEKNKETELSIIYVRKKMFKIIDDLNNSHNEQYFKHRKKLYKYNKFKIFRCTKQIRSYTKRESFMNYNLSCRENKKMKSMPLLNNLQNKNSISYSAKSWNDFSSNSGPFKSKFIVNTVLKSQYTEWPYFNNYSFVRPCWKVYRCQLNTKEETCCCSCNSDAMFEVMKSLYDCYKKKNCDNCKCILCAHLPREERRLGELRKLAKRELSIVPLSEFMQPAFIKKLPPDKVEKLKAVGLLTPLEGKSADQKEKLLKGLVMNGIPLPKGKSTSDKKLIEKIRRDVGLPPEPKTSSAKKKYEKAMASGLITPLSGKSPSEKERILKGQADLGLALPEGRTMSEKNLIAKIKGLKAPSSKLLRDKTPEEKETILKDLALKGMPLPEGKTASEKRLIDKVRTEVGLPPAPKTPMDKKKYEKAMASGLITPLIGKTTSEKELILKGQADMGLALPEGRTMSEKKLIAKIKSLKAPSSKLLRDKTPEEKEIIIKDLAMKGMPLPEGKTESEKKIIDKVRAEVGLPPTPKTPSAKERYDKALAAGHIIPLEGKSRSQKEKILREQAKMGVSLPEGRTPSEKALIAKVKAEIPPEIVSIPERIKRAKAGMMTPLHGKTPEQKENILKELVKHKIPLPVGKTASEKQIIDKVRKDLGLPPEPKSKDEKAKYSEAIVAGLITPLEGKNLSQKEKILQAQADMGIQLPEGRTASEKALIKRIKKKTLPLEKRKKLDEKTLKVVKEGKGPSDECICSIIAPESVYATPVQKEKKMRELAMQGLPLPEAKTASEKKLLEKIQADLGLPPVPTTPSLKEKYARAQDAGLIVPLEGKTKSQKAKILVKQAQMGIPLPDGRTPSEKVLVNKVRATVKPITGKTPEEQKKILRNIAKAGLPLPEGTTPSEKQIIKQVKDDIGLPSKGIPSELFEKAKAAGLITPLEGKTKDQKEKILRERVATGLPLPEGVTPSDKELIKKVKEATGYKTPKYPSKIIKKKSVGLLTPLEGKSPSEKEKILEHQIAAGLPLPEGKTPSEKEIIEKVKKKKSPKLISLRGKSPSQKEKILRHLAKHGLPLPEPKTPSEKVIIDKVKAEVKIPPVKKPFSVKMRLAKAAGLLTPLEGKTAEQKENILRGLVKAGIPLPEGKSKSEKKIIEKVREEVGLPPEPKTPSLREKMKQAQIDGIITPLEGKTPAEKEKILTKMHDAGIPLPKGRSASEKSLVKKIKARPRKLKEAFSEKLRKAKAAGFLTPLEGKTPEQKENIIRGLAKAGVPLPEGRTSSEKKIIEKVREEVGLPPEPKTSSLREKMKQAQIDGIITPLEGKSPAEKEHILQKMHEAGIPLPKGRTASEKSLIKKVKAGVITRPYIVTSKKLREAKAAGLLTPLEGKTATQKEKIITGLAKAGLPLPEGKTPSEKVLINKVKEKIKKIEQKSAKEMKEGKGPSDECICDMLTPMTPRKKPISMTALIGKTPEQKEKYLKDLALEGIPLPEAKTKSDKKLINKIRADIGLPPEPTSPSLKEIYNKAMDAGIITPLQGKSIGQKEKILRGQAAMGLPLPEGRTPSEKELIAKVKATTPPVVRIKSEKIRKAKAAGLLTPLEGKTAEQKEKILKGLAMHGIPLPEPKTSSERNIIDKVRAEVGLPPEPKTRQERQRYDRAVAAGIITPLQGKSPSIKEKILRGQAEMGLSLPEGRTRSEKDLIAKVRATTLPLSKVHIPLKSEKLRKAKAAGILTPLRGKSTEQKEKILKGLAMHGIPLPEPQTSSEKNIIDRVRHEVGLPPEPTTKQEKEIYDKAAAAGIITPLQGKTPSQKEKILRKQAEMGLPLPAGRTRSEQELIARVKATTPPPVKVKSEKLRKAKAAGLLTPLEGKTPEQKEKILKGLAMHGIPLPEAKTISEKNIMDKVRAEVGLPPEPKTRQEKHRYNRAIAAGIITPLQGKSPSIKEKILRGQAELGLPLPEGRTRSEKDLIAKVRATTLPLSKIQIPLKSEKLRKAKAAGILTPLHGKTPEQKEKILKGLAMHGIPLPEPKTSSERNIMDKVRAEVGLPPEPKTKQEKELYDRAIAEGIITPLQGKSPSMKEKILRGQAEMGLPLPEGRTPSEKELIAKVKATTPPVPKIKSEKLRKAKAAGLLTPLEGKTAEQKEKILKGLAMHGIPLPEPKTSSERNIIDKVRAEVGLPPEPKSRQERQRYDRAIAAGIITPLQGKSPSMKEKILRGQAEMGLPLPEGRTRSEKDLIAKVRATTLPLSKVHIPLKSEKLRKAKAAGILTPLHGKTPEQKEKILKGLAMHGIPLPQPKTTSERNIIDKVRAEVGLPPEPKTSQEKDMYDRAIAAGLITPLQGKSPSQKEKILREQAEMGLPLPEGRTPSEKELIAKVRATTRPVPKIKSEKLRKAKAAGLLTPLEGKTAEQKEKILKGLAMHGIPLPEPKTSSERNIIDKVRAEVGLPPEPKTQQERQRYDRAIAAGIITPLQGKSPSMKEKILRGQAEMGLSLPEGRTRSEKDLIAKVKATTLPLSKVQIPLKSEKLRKAKAAGILTPLQGKTPEQKEKILKGLAMHGIPLPEPKTASERNIIDKVRTEVGLPPEPKTRQEKEVYDRATAAGIITPLQGKTPSQKEKILRQQAEMGLPLPEGRTSSEKELIEKVKATTPPVIKVKSEKLRKAKAAGLLTPLEGKSPEQKEKILKGLAMHGIPLPEAKTSSEKKIMDKVRAEVGLPPEPKTRQEKQRYDRAIAAGIITPLQGKSPSQKEKILRGQAEMGLPLPEGRTPSEKDLIAKVRATTLPLSKVQIPLKSEKLRKAKAAGILTPLEGKSPEQKEKILKGLAMHGIPLPEPKTSSERNIMDKVRAEVGLPPEPKSIQEKEMYDRAIAAGLITPLQGKTPSQKEKILRKQAEMGLRLPKGRTPSEKDLIEKVKATTMPPEKLAKLDKKTAKVMKEGKGPSDECICHILSPRRKSLSRKSTEIYKIPSEKLRKAKEAGLLTPLEGKTVAQKEKILKGLAVQGIPLPEGKTDSERKLINKVRAELGLPPEPKTKSAKKAYNKALAEGLITPLQGKSNAQKEKILRKQAELGLLLPEGRTPSEKSLIAKIKETVPPPLETPSLREKISKARAAGLLTPLEGKSLEQKEKILKTLAEAGLPLPEGKTPSEKSLIKKVEAKIKSKKVGEAARRKKGGITEEFEDIIKTTTCDRACGCDKKKIRFKHSYVKIRVTSPDISSLCPCPEECVPGVKGGVFTDNEGIKVTVGRVTGIPSFSSRKSFDGNLTYFERSNITKLKNKGIVGGKDFVINKYHNLKNHKDTSMSSSKSETEVNVLKRCPRNYKTYSSVDVLRNNGKNISSAEIIQSFERNSNNLISSQECFITNTSNNTSFESMYLLNRYSSVSLLTLATSISVISFSTTESSSNSSFYENELSYRNVNLSDYLRGANNFCTSDTVRNSSFESYDCFSNTNSQIRKHLENNILTFRINESKTCYLMETNYLGKKKSAIIHKKNALDMDLICDLLSRKKLNNTSSLVIVVSTTSDEHTSKYSLEGRQQSSTIGLDLLQNHSNWNYKANSLHHLHQEQRGFKITSKGRMKYEKNNTSTMLTDSHKKRNMQQKEGIHERKLPINERYEQKHQIYARSQNNYRIISTDTTQDRPCCCESKHHRLRVPTDISQRKVDSIVTELVTPIILKEAAAQGLSHETYLHSQDNKIIRQSELTVSHSNLEMPTPIRFCKVPPANDHTNNSYHAVPVGGYKNTSSNNATSGTTFKTCDCNPDKLIELFEKRTKDMLSKACNISSHNMIDKRNQFSNANSVPKCNNCGSQKILESTSSSYEKKIKSLCPCEQQKLFIENDIEDHINKQKATFSKDRCKCIEQKHLKKNIICECPEPEPDPAFDYVDWIDETEERKLKSDLTQTISGFKINKPRKKTDKENFELEMSFEETLRYIAENLENESSKYNSDICSCKSDIKLPSKNVADCECPYEPYTPQAQEEETFEEEPFTGNEED